MRSTAPRSLLAASSLFIALHSLVCAAPPAAPADLAPALDPIREKFHTPALAGAIIRDGKLIGLAVRGVRKAQDPDATTSQAPSAAAITDRFPIGSCTKPMTRLTAARLADRGVLDLNAPISAYLEGTPIRDDYKLVTIADILSHRAGIKPYTRIGPQITPFIFELKGSPTEQRAAFSAHVLDEAPAAPPKTKFIYSNAGYCLVASMAEHKTGTAWEQIVSDEVFTPLHLSSAILGPDTDTEHAIYGHDMTPKGLRALPPRPRLAVMVPAGGACLTIADFVTFAAAQAEIDAGRPILGLSEKAMKSLPELRPGDSPANRSKGGEAFYGGDGLYTAAFAVWPAQHLAIAVACNLGESDDACTAAIEAIRASLAPDAPRSPDAGPLATQPAQPAQPDHAPGQPQLDPAPDGPRFGFSMQIEEGGTWKIASIAPGSIAEKAGLKEGDVITEINGTPTKSIEPEAGTKLARAKQVALTLDRAGKAVKIELKK